MTTDDKKIIYSMYRVGKIHPPNKQVLQDISLSFFYGAKIGVIGPNGSGKSTLLRIMAGVDQEYIGEISQSPGFTVGYLPQEPHLDDSKTVRAIVEEAVQTTVDLLREYDEINLKFAESMTDDEMMALIDRQGRVQDELDRVDAWNLDSRLELAMDALRCPPGDTSISVLSGGERRRVALCRLLLKEPDILLLDEPTNHLDAETVAWLEQHLQQYKGTVIAITHDRYFQDNIAGWILELDRGRGIPWKGNYTSWLEQRQARLASEEKSESQRQKMLKRELEWVNMSPRARQAKSKARIEAYNRLLESGGETSPRDLEIYIPPGPRLGNFVIRARDLAKAYGNNLLYDNLTFELPPGAVLGIIGPNGAGKTTLFRMIVGTETPDAGTLEVGQTVELGYVDQSRDTLNSENSVWQEISGGNEQLQLGNYEMNSRAYVSRFGFSGSDQQKKVGVLSGGERNRVHLAKVLKSGANVILLDEPTNDLDVATLRALEEAINNYGGSVIVISHDRWFLDRITTHTLAFEGDSTAFFYPGNYSEYEEDRRKRLGPAADRPHRITYRKLRRD
ncbi:MAG: energy-dependent translational throttle protein EttA [Anaerolineae bacterium]|nr:energy-dependent translational throttle protein EttA [Anaerolineae bacterium]